MGNKRKRNRKEEDESDKENHWEKRFKKLERQLKRQKKERKKKRRRRHSSSSRTSSRDSSTSGSSRGSSGSRSVSSSTSSGSSSSSVTEVRSTRRDSRGKSQCSQRPPLRNVGNEPIPANNDKTNEPEAVEKALDEDILNVIGKRFAADRILAETLHSDVVARWEEILKLGLPADERTETLKKYPPPVNCTRIDPPKLNPEVKSSLQEAVRKRDERIVMKQEKISACLAAVGKALSVLIKRKGEGENLSVIEMLGHTSRLLADLHHDESSIRRNLLLANINSAMKETLNSTTIDEWLFGKDLSEYVKAAKLIENSAKDLKTPQKSQFSKAPKNVKNPPRQSRPKNYPAMGGGHRYPLSHRAPRSSHRQKTTSKKEHSRRRSR